MSDERKTKGVTEAQAQGFEADKATAHGRTLKVRRIGNSLGLVLPKDVLAKLRVGEGDQLSVAETADGIALQPFDGALQTQIDAARRAMKRYRNALRELAK
ncbi:MAG: AbrB/MazE/SpoVT family DNA-binding domain-containing protein [Pseudomonadota bacterium]